MATGLGLTDVAGEGLTGDPETATGPPETAVGAGAAGVGEAGEASVGL